MLMLAVPGTTWEYWARQEWRTVITMLEILEQSKDAKTGDNRFDELGRQMSG